MISAVGHEPDVTISDFVADLRAATPSNAAELAVPDQTELRERLLSAQSRLQQAQTRQLKLARQRLDGLKNKRVLQSPRNYLQDRRLLLDYQQKQLAACARQLLDRKKQRFIRLTAALDAMSPLKVLSRGYSMTRDQDGHVLRDAGRVQVGGQITVTLQTGEVDAVVTTIRGGSHGQAESEL